mmetsp:Transcript_88704/g.286609  ORF Transcript_88704/g.286609 Transcript_88704/m.286609 type:complete len:304 (+) Transcript_88704:1949-2860(+)
MSIRILRSAPSIASASSRLSPAAGASAAADAADGDSWVCSSSVGTVDGFSIFLFRKLARLTFAGDRPTGPSLAPSPLSIFALRAAQGSAVGGSSASALRGPWARAFEEFMTGYIGDPHIHTCGAASAAVASSAAASASCGTCCETSPVTSCIVVGLMILKARLPAPGGVRRGVCGGGGGAGTQTMGPMANGDPGTNSAAPPERWTPEPTRSAAALAPLLPLLPLQSGGEGDGGVAAWLASPPTSCARASAAAGEAAADGVVSMGCQTTAAGPAGGPSSVADIPQRGTHRTVASCSVTSAWLNM